jgi:hypothetical protein
MFPHATRPISFSLVVDSFGIQKIGPSHAEHLVPNPQDTLQHYTQVERRPLLRHHRSHLGYAATRAAIGYNHCIFVRSGISATTVALSILHSLPDFFLRIFVTALFSFASLFGVQRTIARVGTLCICGISDSIISWCRKTYSISYPYLQTNRILSWLHR